MIRLFFLLDGRIPRGTFWFASLALALVGFALFTAVERLVGVGATLALLPPLYWCALALAIKRYHDLSRSGLRLLLLLIPILGPLWVAVELGFLRGFRGENRYGLEHRAPELDYKTVPSPAEPNLINDVTGLNPIPVAAIVVPTSVAEVQEALRRFSGPVCVGGGRFSMGGQTASPGALHLDLRRLNKVLEVAPQERRIRVQAGARWCDLQRVLDVHGLAVKIMQTYANFTVGGSLSVNCHGRYVGLGPLILSTRRLTLVLADGSAVEASPEERPELFYGAIGGYGGLGIIVEVELSVAENLRVERRHVRVKTPDYVEHFKQRVRSQPTAVYHNGDLYPPHYSRLRSVTWFESERCVTEPYRLQPVQADYPLLRYFFWAVSETPFGAFRREFLFEPLFYLRRAVHWRNFESGYDVAELEPATRKWKTYVLQEYFVPIARFEDFVGAMGAIFRRYKVNVVNVSIRHAIADPGSLLAWAREEVFAFVVYYKQGVSERAKSEVAVWTRELIDAVLEVGGSWYLPYQAHATPEQFRRGYPRADEYFALKARLDPELRFRNALWDRYAPGIAPQAPAINDDEAPASEFHAVVSDPRWCDRLYLFLQNVYRLYPERSFHWLIKETCARHHSDEAIYRAIQEGLPSIKPLLGALTYALPALRKQKRVLRDQTLDLLGARRVINGYLEIGTTGRYLSALRGGLDIRGPQVLLHEAAPSNSPVDIMERGQLGALGSFISLDDYAPISEARVPDASLELVTCYVGLHHCPLDKLDAFVASLRRVLAPGGQLILREHDAAAPRMKTFVSLIHTVFNAGLDLPWREDQAELRHFRGVDEWSAYLGERGFRDSGRRVFQDHDPSDNALLLFTRDGGEA